MLSKIRLTYDKENSNNTKFIIDDGTNQRIIILTSLSAILWTGVVGFLGDF